VESGDHRLLSALLAWGGYRHEVDDDGNGPLHIASIKNDFDSVRLLLDAMKVAKVIGNVVPDLQPNAELQQGPGQFGNVPNVFQSPITNKSGETPLHLAASHGHERIVKLLLEQDFDVNAVTTFGNTPLHAAAINGRTRIISVLISKGANRYLTNSHDRVPLYYAAAGGDTQCCLPLMPSPPLFFSGIFGARSAFIIASKKGNYDVVEMLLRLVGQFSIFRALKRAVRQGHCRIVQLLLSHWDGLSSWQGEELLVIAQASTKEGKSYDVMKLLIQSGARTSGRAGRLAIKRAEDDGANDVVKLARTKR
jgi:ankyrin repeat protein